MKRNPEFRLQILQSKYYNPKSTETVKDVYTRWDVPINLASVYQHLKNHSPKELTPVGKLKVDVVTLESLETETETPHLQGLDDFIAQGRRMLANGQLKITGDTFLKAVKTKADIEDKNKDRKLDAMKMMAGVYGKSKPREVTDSQSES